MRRAVPYLLLLALLAVGPATATGQQPGPATATPRFETILPADTFAVISVSDVSTLRGQMARTALGELWREPEVQQYLKPGLEWMEKEMKKAIRKAPVPIMDLLGMVKGQVGLAVVNFDPMYGGMIPDAVVYVDLGDRQADFHSFLMKMIDSAGDQMAVREEGMEGFTWMNVTTPMGMDVSIAYFGSAMVMSMRPDRMPKLVKAWREEVPGGLVQSETWRTAMDRVGGSGTWMNVFVNVESMLGYFGDRMDPMAGSIMEATGMTGLKALSMGSTFAEEGIRDSFFAYVPGEKRGLMKIFYTAGGPGGDLLKLVPRNAVYASAGRADLDKILGIVLEVAEAIDPLAADQVRMGLDQAKEMLGIDIRADLLAPMGDEMALYAALPASGGLFPDVLVLAKLDDPKRFENALTQIVARAKMMLEDQRRLSLEHRTMEFMGKTIHYVHVAHRRGDPFPVTPTFLIDGDLLVLGLFPQPVKDFVARAGAGPSILERPDFARVVKGLPEGLTSMEYVDLGAAVRLLYGTLVPLAQAAGKAQKCPVDQALLPRTETIAKHLFGAAWGFKAADDGMELHAYSQVGVLPVVAMAGLPMLYLARAEGMGMPPGAHRTEEARPATPVEPARPVPAPAAANPRVQLKEIYIALLYQYAERNAYPENLGALVESRALENAGSLLLPDDGSPLPAGGEYKSSFAYVGPKVGSLTQHTDQAVWVYQRDGLGGDARWVLFADGSVRQVPESQFAALLAATRTMLEK